MKRILAYCFLAVLCLGSCHRNQQKPSQPVQEEGKINDSLAYALLEEYFNMKFAGIEEEYDTANAERQLELEKLFEETDRELLEAQKQFIRDYPASLQALRVLNEVDWSFETASEYREYLDLLDPTLQESAEYMDMDNLAGRMEKVEIGRQAPDFTMMDVNGKPQKLSEHYRNSRFLLLDFWASNCGPCRTENVNIRQAYNRFHEAGFEVLGVSTDTRREPWLNAIEKDGLIWTNLCALEPWNKNEVVSLYALREVSQNFLLDASGKIVGKNIRGEELTAALEERFK